MTPVTQAGALGLAKQTSPGNGASQGYTYSTQGDLLTLASTLTGASNTTTNTFTKAHQLASESASNAAWGYLPAVFQTTAYSAANTLNQYVNVTVGANPTATLGYDANGNLTGDGVWTFAYDAQNMLRTASSAALSASYQYDPMGRRQMLTEGATTTTFLHDGDEEIADYAATNALLRRYVPGPGTDMPIAMVTPSGGSNTRAYFHTNRQGSTIAMSADNGTMSEGPYTYDAYGSGAPATGVPFKYTGRRLDPGTGLYYYRARYYSKDLGRFLQVDPVGYSDHVNLYSYVRNDPLNGVDPRGTDVLAAGYQYVAILVYGGSYERGWYYDTETGEYGTYEKTGVGQGAHASTGPTFTQQGGGVSDFNGKSSSVDVDTPFGPGATKSVTTPDANAPVGTPLSDVAGRTMSGSKPSPQSKDGTTLSPGVGPGGVSQQTTDTKTTKWGTLPSWNEVKGTVTGAAADAAAWTRSNLGVGCPAKE